VTWLFPLILGQLFPSRFGSNNCIAEVEAEVEHEVAATSFFISDHQVNYDMEDYVYDSDCGHKAESEWRTTAITMHRTRIALLYRPTIPKSLLWKTAILASLINLVTAWKRLKRLMKMVLICLPKT
jgi:hypothetical protein